MASVRWMHTDCESFCLGLGPSLANTALAMASGEIDISLLSPAPTEKGTPGAGAKESPRRMATLTEGIDSFLGGLIRYWVRSYGKPLISTTFTEGVSHLRGRHFAYPSGERAARVLIKLVEYSEYLEREGIKV